LTLFPVVHHLLPYLHQAGGFLLAVGILSVGVYLTVKSGFFQLRSLFFLGQETKKRDARSDLPSRQPPGEISPFSALTTALAATVGTGNLAGVATALTLGGPGSIFWMWLSAFFGMMLKFSEIVLAVTYRRFSPDGTVSGGPMYVLAEGLRQPWLGFSFALCGSLAALGIGNLVQANTVAIALQASLRIPPAVTGVCLALLTAAVILGGIRRVGAFTAQLVPLMTLAYLIMALVILVSHRHLIPVALVSIISDAFTGSAAAGGFAGAGVYQAFRYGITRGIFTNEAGLGSASIAHAAARTSHPVKQGLWGMAEVFIDTHLLCTVTALTLLVTGAWTSGLEGISITVEAFNRGLPWEEVGGLVIVTGLIFFSFSTLISWSYYGEKCFQFILSGRHSTYRILWVALVPLGALGGLQAVWAWADTLNALMAIPNLAALLGLSSLVKRMIP